MLSCCNPQINPQFKRRNIMFTKKRKRPYQYEPINLKKMHINPVNKRKCPFAGNLVAKKYRGKVHCLIHEQEYICRIYSCRGVKELLTTTSKDISYIA